MLIHLVTVMTV